MPTPLHVDATVHVDANGTETRPTASTIVSREIQNVLADAEDLIKATTSLTGDDLMRVRARLVNGVAAAKASLENAGGVIADKARRTAKVTDAYVHDSPWIAIGAGAAIGLLAGLLLTRRGS